jgi:hypothetical protein
VASRTNRLASWPAPKPVGTTALGDSAKIYGLPYGWQCPLAQTPL